MYYYNYKYIILLCHLIIINYISVFFLYSIYKEYTIIIMIILTESTNKNDLPLDESWR